MHPGGCHVVMADGAVKFISETTSATLLAQLARVADGIIPNLP
jgi:prepilin-type processing-associated H-X9-DG protein